MKRRLILRSAALEDVTEALDWYSRRGSAPGQRFLDEFIQMAVRVRDTPQQFPRLGSFARRALLQRFPYAVYFLEQEHQVVIFAVLHTHRNPATWRDRRS